MAENNEKNNGSTSGGNISYVEILKRKLAEQAEKAKSQGATTLPEPDGKKLENRQKKEKKAVEKIEEKPKNWKETIKNDNRSAKGSKANSGEVETKKERSLLKTLGIIVLCAVVAVVLIVGGYFAFLQVTYRRIEDMKYLATTNPQLTRLTDGAEYSITTFNIGFGAYGQSFSFFMDQGEMLNGTITQGKSSRAESEEDVLNNISGAVSLVKSKAVSDFYFFQEVDTDSTRSHYVNQVKLLNDAFSGYASVYAENAHSKYLFYPLTQPIGKINSGILTLSKYSIDYSVRRSLVIETGMIDKLFDLDRCFTISKLPIYGSSKYLVLVNVHLSAYDDGDIRKQQIAALYDYMNYEYNTNKNYVVVGGDFNLCLAGESGIFNNGMKTPGWCQSLPEGYTADNFASIGYTINYDISATIGTCRDASIKYTEGLNLEVVIDGFMTSGNITVKSTSVIDGDFKNSDHNPVRMEFKLG